MVKVILYHRHMKQKPLIKIAALILTKHSLILIHLINPSDKELVPYRVHITAIMFIDFKDF